MPRPQSNNISVALMHFLDVFPYLTRKEVVLEMKTCNRGVEGSRNISERRFDIVQVVGVSIVDTE